MIYIYIYRERERERAREKENPTGRQKIIIIFIFEISAEVVNEEQLSLFLLRITLFLRIYYFDREFRSFKVFIIFFEKCSLITRVPQNNSFFFFFSKRNLYIRLDHSVAADVYCFHTIYVTKRLP